MKIRRLFFLGVLLLALGLWLIFFYCHGTIGGAGGDSISAFSLKVDMTTVGYPVIFGLPSMLLGALLVLAGVIATVVLEVRGVFSRKSAVVLKRDEPSADEHSRRL